MPKRKWQLTMSKDAKKRKAKKQRVGGEPTAPSAEEWSTMKVYKSFIVNDVQDVPHAFTVNKYAIIVPHDKRPDEHLEDHEYWVGKIKGIRCRNDDPSEVWTSIQWLYSGADVAQEKHPFDRTSCARMERFISNGNDFVHSSTFQGLVKCIHYDESDIDQPMISDDDFFYRYSFDVNTKRITPTPYGTCLCHKPYNPDTTALMHFCPRYTCQKAFDAACLEKANNKETEDVQGRAPRHIQFERSLPSVSVPATRDPSMPNLGADKHRHSDGLPCQGNYDNIPDDLLALARSPMVKGKKLPAGGVVGNIPFVMRARQLVFEILQNGSDASIDWETALGLADIDANELIAKDTHLLCPGCGGAI